ncbi:unnamed protein product [Rhizophagus irregularis]|nr:unnamed protein product [Rhizophagus irregularis]
MYLKISKKNTEIQRFVWHSGGLPKIGNPKNSFSSRVTSEDWKSKEFVQHWGDFQRMEKTKFHSVSGGASEFRRTKKTKIRSVNFQIPKIGKEPRFVSIYESCFGRVLAVSAFIISFGSFAFLQSLVGFRVLKNNEKSRFVSGVSSGIPKNRIPKDSFLSVLERWIYRFGLRFLGVEYTDFGSWILDIWI